jgi:hypothetical protein
VGGGADKLRNNMDAAEYKHVVLGLIFLKYISDAFEERTTQAWQPTPSIPTPRTATSTRPRTSSGCPRRRAGRASGKRQAADDRQVHRRRDGRHREGQPAHSRACSRKTTRRPSLDKQRLGELIDLISAHRARHAESRSKDVLGRVYEYFLSSSPIAEGKGGGEFYTPQSVRKAARRNARAVQGPRLRPLLRLGRHVRVSPRSSSTPRARGRPLHLRAGEQQHDMATVQDEPCHSRHRRQHRPAQRRHLP